jgi:hypothetical protein
MPMTRINQHAASSRCPIAACACLRLPYCGAVRSRSRATLGAAIAAAFVATVACVPEPDVELTSGTVESREFTDHVKYYDLDLPADVRALEWVQLRDWDSNQIYLRFSTDRAGLAKLLGAYRLTWGALKPSSSSSSPALPRKSDWDEELPSRFIQWQPSTWSTSRAIDQVRNTNSNGLTLSVDLLVDRPAAERPDVFIHIVEF